MIFTFEGAIDTEVVCEEVSIQKKLKADSRLSAFQSRDTVVQNDCFV